MFIKSLHAAYGRFLNLGLAEDVTALLADFQAEAVRRCLTMLERHWGAMLCDSVGLGKTWEGLGILSEFARRRDGQARALIVCPAQLESNWDHERTREFDIRKPRWHRWSHCPGWWTSTTRLRWNAPPPKGACASCKASTSSWLTSRTISAIPKPSATGR